MDEQIPGPDGRVTALAERERLGRRRMVAANRNNRFRTGWGETLAFGRISLDRNGVSFKRKTASWAEIGEANIVNASVWFNNSRGRSLLPDVSVSQVPNLYLLLALADRLRG